MQDLEWFEAGIVIIFKLSIVAISLCCLFGLAYGTIKLINFTSNSLVRYSLFHHAHLGNIEMEELDDAEPQAIQRHMHYKSIFCLLAVLIELCLFTQAPYDIEPKRILFYLLNTVLAIDTIGSIVQEMPDIDLEDLYII